MIRTFLIVMLAAVAMGQTSNIQAVKGWTRTHIMGIPGGKVLDPTHTIADGQRSAAVIAIAEQSGVIVAGAAEGLTNALTRLYDVADQTNKFTGRLYIAADLDTDPGYENVESFVVDEINTPSNVIYYTHYTHLLDEPPRTMWQFNPAEGVTYWAPGSIDTNNVTELVRGFQCYKITVQRPSQIGNIILRTHRYLKWGTPDTPLSIPDAGLELACGGSTNAPFTGSITITNSQNEITESYISGFWLNTTTNVIEVTP